MREEKRKSGEFLLHGTILAAASIFVRLIGMIYRIPMVNIIGSEGSGYYSNAYSVYNILLLLSSYSLPLAVSKMVSSRIAVDKWKETKKILIVSLVFAGAVGLVFALITLFGADFFCSVILGSPKSAIALRFMAPTILIMSFLGVLRGFFQGHENTVPTAVSQVLEQIVNAAVSVGMAAILFHAGVVEGELLNDPSLPAARGASGGTIGTGAGALTALIFFIVIYFVYRKYFIKRVGLDRSKTTLSYGKLLHILTLTAVPIIASTAAYNSVDIIDASLFNHAMMARGVEETVYSSIWGDYNNAFLLLIHLPVAVSGAVASALVPALSAAFVRHDRQQVLSKISLTITVTIVFSLACAFAEMAIGGNLANLLFSKLGPDAGKYLTVGGLSVLFFSLSTVTNAILQGLNKMQRPVLHALIALGVHVLLLCLMLFVFKMGVYAVILSYMIYGAVVTVLNLISIHKLTGFMIKPVKSVLFPVVSAFIMVLICLLISFVISRFLSGRVSDLLIILMSLVFGGAAYLAMIFLTGALTKKDLKEFPKGEKIASFLQKLHLLR